jgi:hypothetical protein
MKMNVPPEQEESPQVTSPESSDSPALTKRQAARRRILGAALGAPVIYTLPSGAAQAARSNLCEDNSDSALDPVRVQGSQSGGTTTFEVKKGGVDICVLDADGECVYQNKTWIYDGTYPTNPGGGNAVDDGRLVTQSCWTSMGNATSLIGTNWSNLG